jgi:hypothetical protein
MAFGCLAMETVVDVGTKRLMAALVFLVGRWQCSLRRTQHAHGVSSLHYRYHVSFQSLSWRIRCTNFDPTFFAIFTSVTGLSMCLSLSVWVEIQCLWHFYEGISRDRRSRKNKGIGEILNGGGIGISNP